MARTISIAELAELVGASIPPSVSPASLALHISKLNSLADAKPDEASFLSNPKLFAQLQATRAGVVFVKATDVTACPAGTVALLVKDPYLAFARASHHWANKPATGIHPQAYVAATAKVAASATISAFAYVGERVVIGEGTLLHPRATVLDDSQIGENCILHSGCVVGSDGFGFAPADKTWVKIAQLGRVIIHNDVEVGANTTIDRGALHDTVIHRGVKLDNQIQIAHNVVIGEHTAIAACVGIAGSTTIGARCTVGGAAGIIGHLSICDDVHISAFSLVQSSISQPGQYTGVYPLEAHASWEKNAATLRRLAKLRERVQQLERDK
jgi:UDP-3-O-[3-hydroxymyristoyl] glucosamine N-acyltransferase